MEEERRFDGMLNTKSTKKKGYSYFSLNTSKEELRSFQGKQEQSRLKSYQSDKEKKLKKSFLEEVEERISDKRFKLTDLPPGIDIRKMDFSSILDKREFGIESERKNLKKSGSKERRKRTKSGSLGAFNKNYQRITQTYDENSRIGANRACVYKSKGSSSKKKMRKEAKKEPRRSRGRRRMQSNKLRGDMSHSQIMRNSHSQASVNKSRDLKIHSRSKDKGHISRVNNISRNSSKKTFHRRSANVSRSSLYSKINQDHDSSPHSMINKLKSRLQIQTNKYNQMKSQFNLQKSENKKLKNLNELIKGKEIEKNKENSKLKKCIETMKKELEAVKLRMNFFVAIENEIGKEPDLQEFIECNLGINKKLELKLRKGNENFAKICKQYEDLKKVNARLKKENENLNSKISVMESRERIRVINEEAFDSKYHIPTVKEKLEKERKKARRVKSRARKMSNNKKKKQKGKEEKSLCSKCSLELENIGRVKAKKRGIGIGLLKKRPSPPSQAEFDKIKGKLRERQKELVDLKQKLSLLNNELSRLSTENHSLRTKLRSNHSKFKKPKSPNFVTPNNKFSQPLYYQGSTNDTSFENKTSFSSFCGKDEILELEQMKENIDYNQLMMLYNKLVQRHHRLIKKIKSKKEERMREKQIIEEEIDNYGSFNLSADVQKPSYFNSETSEEDQDFIFAHPDEPKVKEFNVEMLR